MGVPLAIRWKTKGKVMDSESGTLISEGKVDLGPGPGAPQ